MKRSFYFIFCFLFITQLSKAQNSPDLQTSCATTGQATAGNYIISYTIGEMVEVQNYKIGNLLVTQGVLQPDLGKNTGTVINNFEPGEITVFPNPTPDAFVARVNIFAPGQVSLYLYNSLGQVLQKDALPYNAFIGKRYNLQNAAAGMYLLKIIYQSADGKTHKEGSFKVIKTAQ